MFFVVCTRKKPIEVAQELEANMATVCRYYRDWRKRKPNFDQMYNYVKSLFKKESPDREGNLKLFAQAWRIEPESLEDILAQPHGLKRLLTGKLYMPAHADLDHKLSIAFRLALLISDHLVNRGKVSDIYYALKLYMQENKKNREEEDADIKEHNKIMQQFHKIFVKEMEDEKKGCIKQDTFSEEERNFIIKWGIDNAKKETEISYWANIGGLMFQGLTEEEAREKVLQNVINKGTPKEVEVFSKFQNEIHPIKTKNHLTCPPKTVPSIMS